MVGSSLFAFIGTCVLTLGQLPIDETNSESTIKVIKKKKKGTDSAEKKKQVPQARRVSTPPPPRVAPTPAPKTEAKALPRAPAPKTAPRQDRLVPSQKIEGKVGSTKVLPWVTLGVSAVAVAVGSVFAVKTVRSLDQQEFELELDTRKDGDRIEVPEEFRDQQKSVFIGGLTATVLISAGVSGGIASVVALSSD